MKLLKKNNNPINHEKNINELISLSIDINNENNKDIINYSNIIYSFFVNNYNFLLDNKNFYNRDRVITDNCKLSPIFYGSYFLSGADGDFENLKDIDFIKNNYNYFVVNPDAICYSVGAAIGEKHARGLINSNAVQYNVYAIVSEENVLNSLSIEASRFAGLYKLDNLVIVTCTSNVQNIKSIYEALSFSVFTSSNNYDSITSSFNDALKSGKPSIILVDDMNFNYDTNDVSLVKKNLNVRDMPFTVSNDVMEDFQYLIDNRVSDLEKRFQKPITELDSDSSITLKSLMLNNKRISSNNIVFIPEEGESLVSLTNKLMDSYYENSKILIGAYTGDNANKESIITPDDYSNNRIDFSDFKYSSAYILNGLCESGFRPYLFTDSYLYRYFISASFYATSKKLPIIYVIENNEKHAYDMSYLRAGDTDLFTPFDSNELLGSMKAVMTKEEGVSAILVSNTSATSSVSTSINNSIKGGYVLCNEKLNFDGIIISSGSSIKLAKEVSDILFSRGHDLRVVSITNLKRFLTQDSFYQDEVLPVEKRKIIIENSNSSYWNKIVFNSKYILNYKDFDELKNDPKLFAEKIESILK